MLNSPDCCGDTCCDAESVAIPGPQGNAGENGENGSDGINSFSLTTDSFVVPAEGATVQIDLSETEWMVQSEGAVPGQIVAIQFAGYYEVVSVDTSLLATVRNLADVAAGEYPDNAPPAAVIPTGSRVSPAGIQGPAGEPEAGALLSVNNLSDVDDAALSRGNLGLGDLAVQNTVNNDDWSGTDLAVTNGGTGASSAAAARTNLGAAASGLATASGLTVSTGQRILGKASGAPAGAVEEIICTTFAQSLLDDADATTARATLGVSGNAGSYAFSAVQTGAQGFANITLTQVEFGATEFDDQGVWDTVTNEFEADVDGIYFFMGQVVWTGFAGAVEMNLQVQKNGVAVAEYVLDVESNAAGEAGIQISCAVSLVATDIITLWASQTSGSGESTDADAARTFFKGWAIATS